MLELLLKAEVDSSTQLALAKQLVKLETVGDQQPHDLHLPLLPYDFRMPVDGELHVKVQYKYIPVRTISLKNP